MNRNIEQLILNVEVDKKSYSTSTFNILCSTFNIPQQPLSLPLYEQQAKFAYSAIAAFTGYL